MTESIRLHVTPSLSHSDEDYAHIHAIILNINPDTGYRYNLKGNYLKLSTWAQAYEAEHGGIISLRRALNNELRAAIDARAAGAVLENLTKQRPTVTEAQIDTALAKQIKDQDQRREFVAQILSHHTHDHHGFRIPMATGVVEREITLFDNQVFTDVGGQIKVGLAPPLGRGQACVNAGEEGMQLQAQTCNGSDSQQWQIK